MIINSPRGWTIIFTVCVLSLARSVVASDETDFLTTYRSHEKQLVDQYVHNRLIRSVIKDYADETYSGLLQYHIESVTVSVRDSMRMNWTISGPKQPVKTKSGALWLGDEIYNLEQQRATEYRLESHHRSATHGLKVEETLTRSRIFLPLSFTGEFRLTEHFKTMIRQRERGYPFTVKSVRAIHFAGRPAVQVITLHDHTQIQTTSYFDPHNAYALLHYEKDGLVEPPNIHKKQPIRVTGTLTYSAGPEGFPIPKDFKSWFHMPDGRKVHRLEVVYTEYSRYTPTVDDFDLEKQFGIKPFPKPTPPGGGSALARARGWWLYAAVAGLVVVTAGLLAYRWRRRSATA